MHGDHTGSGQSPERHTPIECGGAGIVPAAAARGGAAAVVAIVGGPAHTERRTRLDPPDQPGELFEGLVAGSVEHGRRGGLDPLVFSPFRAGALSVANWSSSAESFPWTSMTVRAFARSASRRAFSALGFAISLSRGSACGRPAGTASTSRAPLSRCCRHVVINDEYRPSRRSRAPLPFVIA